MSNLLYFLYVGLIVEDLNLTENFSQENRMGKRKFDFMSLENMNAAHSKVNSICYDRENKENCQFFHFCSIISFWTLLFFIVVKLKMFS